MDLNSYQWSQKNGWYSDKYGVSWQLMKGHQPENTIIPSLMFCQQNAGKAEEAMDSSMPHMFTFNEGVSFVVVVDTQEGKCGWLKDKYGLSW